MRFALVFAALAAAPAVAFSQALPAGAQLAASCAMCHGVQGLPLAGMPKEELMRKLAAFRSGAVPATVMHQIAKGYTDPQLGLIAEHLAAQKK
jgi:sulfide dehydrogenase cytochrome subunit